MMKRYKTNYIFCWILLFLLLSICKNSLPNDHSFTKDEAIKNAKKYLSIICEKTPPTLKDYKKYHSPHDESEVVEELNECDRIFGKSLFYVNGKATYDKQCLEFIKQRQNSPDISPSFCLIKLQKLIAGDGDKLDIRITEVKIKRYGERHSVYMVYGYVNSNSFILSHAISPLSLELRGLVSLVELNGKNIVDIMGNSK